MEENIYPLKFYPIFKNYLWGGNELSKFGKVSKEGSIAESWEISGNSNGESIIKNGVHKDVPLNEIISKLNTLIIGDKLYQKNFPILVKLISSKENLSIQVHPTDEYAQKHEKQLFGKTEMWYILEANENAYIYYGLKEGTTKKDLEKSLKDNSIEEYLYKKYVKPGDVIYIPAGTVHCLRKGITLIEIQQNSDLTYRLYDYNRKDKNGKKRELHIDKALDVIDFNNNAHKYKTNQEIELLNGLNYQKKLLDCPIFKVKLLHIENEQKMKSNNEKFYTYTVINGSGELICNTPTTLEKGDSILIPAHLGNYTLNGNMELIIAEPNIY